jgi:hypothetical protein
MLRLDNRFSVTDTACFRFNFDAAPSDVPLVEAGSYLNDRQLVASRPEILLSTLDPVWACAPPA